MAILTARQSIGSHGGSAVSIGSALIDGRVAMARALAKHSIEGDDASTSKHAVGPLLTDRSRDDAALL